MYFFDSSMLVLIPAIIFTMIVQFRVQHVFNKFSNKTNSMGITGGEAARTVLNANGLYDVEINLLGGTDALENYYDPRNNTLNLSQVVFNSRSISAMCVACHEAGHAIQHAKGYIPVKIRGALVPITNFASNISWTLILIGLILSTFTDIGSLLFDIGALCFIVVVLFQLITLPVEFNASHRALVQMKKAEIVDRADLSGSKKVLHAAAMTYVAALATALSSLLRIFILRGDD